VAAAVYQKLLSLFDPAQTNIWGFVPQFGMPIYNSVLVSILQQVEGVRNLAIASPGDMTLSFSEFPILGSVSVAGDGGLTWTNA
jgi:hypothetical protein